MVSPPTWREFAAGGSYVCSYVCAGVGGWLCAWVRLSTLLLFDGTRCAFIHYSWHAEGATLGQTLAKACLNPSLCLQATE